MKNNNEIRKYFEKIDKEDLTPSELQNLNCFLENPENSNDIFSDEWEKANDFSNEYKSKLEFEKIREKTGIGKNHPKPLDNNRNLFYSFLKYAAILIIGIGVSWIIFAKTYHSSSVSDISKICSITVAYGSKTTIHLPDGSTVQLNSGSTLTYPSNFDKTNRTVSLKGEGFFDVTKDAKKPFFVKTEQVTIKVLGTSFNVKSYPDESKTETTLVNGKVEIYKNENNKLPCQLKECIAILEPKQKVVIFNNTLVNKKKIQPIVKPRSTVTIQNPIKIEEKVKTELYTDWRKNILVFDNENFTDIITILERWYNVEIMLKNKDLKNIRFSGKFDLESIPDVLNALALIQNFKYEIKKNKITIY